MHKEVLLSITLLSASYDDRHGLWGGSFILLQATGHLTITTRKRGQTEAQTSERQISASDALRHLQQIAHVAEARFPSRISYLPDESHQTITLHYDDGRTRSVTYWADDPEDPRFRQAVDLFLRYQ
jgi:hypothetical protein